MRDFCLKHNLAIKTDKSALSPKKVDRKNACPVVNVNISISNRQTKTVIPFLNLHSSKKSIIISSHKTTHENVQY